MEQFRSFFIIVDISGYTGFVRMHRTAMVHAEQIITDLMEGVLERQKNPLILDKLMGDAAIFYARDDGDAGNGAAISAQVMDFFQAFTELESQLVSCNVCLCDACNTIDGLRLKAILHHGDLLLKEMGGSTELAGADIIVAHRLLKNHVQSDEYILMTKAFHDLAGDIDGLQPHWAQEIYDIDTLDVAVFYPDPAEAPKPVVSVAQRVSQFIRIEWHGIKRMLGASASADFRNIPPKAD